MSAAPLSSWADLLDALEEHHRRCADALRGAAGAPAEVVLNVQGPLPPELRVRAEMVLEQTRRLEERLHSRGQAVRRAQHYGAP